MLWLKNIIKILIILINAGFVKKAYEEDEVKVRDHDHITVGDQCLENVI